MHVALQTFHPLVAAWFSQTLGEPTRPQAQGWPHIAAGESSLILAPTGSGKTLAAFLVAIDRVARDLLARDVADRGGGVRILYVSPLKSLANDVQKNLLRPLEQIAQLARQANQPWPEIQVALRTGDTPARDRVAMLRDPPHILITTPESLNLLLTSGGRKTLRTARWVIVDEVHAMAGNKRGTFLSLLLERLEHERALGAAERLADVAAFGAMPSSPSGATAAETTTVPLHELPANAVPVPVPVPAPAQTLQPLVRIGLSATARPAGDVARWLGGCDSNGKPRPVTIIETGQRKQLDLAVLCPWAHEKSPPPASPIPDGSENSEGHSHWPAVGRALDALIRGHAGTLVFVNSRRLVERVIHLLRPDEAIDGDGAADEGLADEMAAEVTPSGAEAAPRHSILPHHGSISRDVRLGTEQALKAGRVSAVVATSSLELGVDLGHIDLVCQVDSPGSVAAALQRAGRAGHLEKATAKGRFIARMRHDLLPLAALAPLMFAGLVEETRVIENALDVLAQQIVAACAVQSWRRLDLLALMRRAAGYARLPEAQFTAVIAMLAASRDAGRRLFSPRISFDRVNDMLHALPGSGRLAMTNGGVIADTGQYPVFVVGTMTRIGELDEEFVYECKENERIILGSQAWQIITIDANRITVAPGGGGSAKMPFWRGETAPRSLLLGRAVAAFNRALAEKMVDPVSCADWLRREHRLDAPAADALLDFARRQRSISALPTDRRIVVEHFVDESGEPLIAVLCPLGSALNHTLRLALEAVFSAARVVAQIVHNDDGLLIRAPAVDAPIPEDVLSVLYGRDIGELVTEQLESASVFGLRFRHNAARALMLPRPDPTRRTPLWQQRLRSRHLLAAVRRERNFPIVLETFRECLRDVLNIEDASKLIADVASGAIEMSVHRGTGPSPLGQALLNGFQQIYQYQSDDPLRQRDNAPSVDAAAIDALLERQPRAALSEPTIWNATDVAMLDRRLAGSDYPARDAEELFERIAATGPIAANGFADPRWAAMTVGNAEPWLRELMDQRRVLIARLPDGANGAAAASAESVSPSDWWIATETLPLLVAALAENATPGAPHPALYRYVGETLEPFDQTTLPAALLRPDLDPRAARETLARQFFQRRSFATVAEMKSALPFVRDIDAIVSILLEARALERVPGGDALALPENLLELRVLALRRKRQGVQSVTPADLQRHILTWQHLVHPGFGGDALEDALDQLAGLFLPTSVWVHDVLPARVADFQVNMLETLCAEGHWTVIGGPGETIGLCPRHTLAHRAAPPPGREHGVPTAPNASHVIVLDLLRAQGANHLVDLEIASGLPTETIQSALRELFFTGVVSNDRFATIARLADSTAPKKAAAAGENRASASVPQSMVRGGPRGSRRPRMKGLTLGGRWYLLPPIRADADPLDLARRATARAEALLQRYGFACRELCDPVADGPWRNCYDVLSRMEWAQVVRRGYFVEGVSGGQFVVPGVTLAARRDASADGGPIVWISMLDPANMFARMDNVLRLSDGQPLRFTRVAGNFLALIGGTPVLAAGLWGSHLTTLSEDAGAIARAAKSITALLRGLPANRRFVETMTWNEQSIIGSPGEASLMAAGFVRNPRSLRLYRDYGLPRATHIQPE